MKVERREISLLLQSFLELVISSAMHLFVGFYMLSYAIALDLSIAMIAALKPSCKHGNHHRPLSTATPKTRRSTDQTPPIVLVHGIFGFGEEQMGRLSYFGGAEKMDEHVLVPDLGSLSSLHDRARELFYYLKGGRVDYGEEHSRCFGHSRFGRFYDQGRYPVWDENHGVHFVGHSAGAQVARVLQQMLADKEFEGFEDTSADWVASITSISGALNGSTRPYIEGIRVEDGRTMRSVCMLQICRLGIIFYDWFSIPWLKSYYNFGFDQFGMDWRRTGVWGLADLLLGNSGPFASGDWILPDLTIAGAARVNSGLDTHPNTYYFSYAGNPMTTKPSPETEKANTRIYPLLYIPHQQMRRWRHPAHLPLPYKGYVDEDWEDNDGALNTISMTHPRIPHEHPSRKMSDGGDEGEYSGVRPGIWHYEIFEADHIHFIVNREKAGAQYDNLYGSIFRRCRWLDGARRRRCSSSETMESPWREGKLRGDS